MFFVAHSRRLTSDRYQTLLRETRSLHSNWAFKDKTILAALLVLNKELKLVPAETAEQWAAPLGLRLSAVFRHFAQSLLRGRSWTRLDWTRSSPIADQESHEEG